MFGFLWGWCTKNQNIKECFNINLFVKIKITAFCVGIHFCIGIGRLSQFGIEEIDNLFCDNKMREFISSRTL